MSSTLRSSARNALKSRLHTTAIASKNDHGTARRTLNTVITRTAQREKSRKAGASPEAVKRATTTSQDSGNGGRPSGRGKPAHDRDNALPKTSSPTVRAETKRASAHFPDGNDASGHDGRPPTQRAPDYHGRASKDSPPSRRAAIPDKSNERRPVDRPTPGHSEGAFASAVRQAPRVPPTPLYKPRPLASGNGTVQKPSRPFKYPSTGEMRTESRAPASSSVLANSFARDDAAAERELETAEAERDAAKAEKRAIKRRKQEDRAAARVSLRTSVQAAANGLIGRLSQVLAMNVSTCSDKLKTTIRGVCRSRGGKGKLVKERMDHVITQIGAITGQTLAMRVIALEVIACKAADNLKRRSLGVAPGETHDEFDAAANAPNTEAATTTAENSTTSGIMAAEPVGRPLRGPLSKPWSTVGMVPPTLRNWWTKEQGALLIQFGRRTDRENCSLLYKRPPVPFYRLHEEIPERPLSRDIRRLVRLGHRLENAKIMCALHHCAAQTRCLQKEFDLVMETVDRQRQHKAMYGVIREPRPPREAETKSTMTARKAIKQKAKERSNNIPNPNLAALEALSWSS